MARFISLFCLLFLSTQAFSQVLRVLFGPYNAPPYAFINDGNLTGGIIFDLGELISEELGISVEYVNIPRPRVEMSMDDETVDLIIIANPNWYSDSDLYHWGPEMWVVNEAIITPNNVALSSLNDLVGKTVGAQIGFDYGNINPYFEQGDIIRVDALNHMQSIQMIQAGRLDAIIMADVLALYVAKDLDLESDFNINTNLLQSNPISWAISPKSKIDKEILLEVAIKLVSNGSVEAILNTYR